MALLPRFFMALALTVATPAFAQETGEAAETPSASVANGQKYGAWTVDCVALAVGKTNCSLTQRILRASDGAFVADMIAVQDAEDQTFLIARVPIGASLPSGFAMREESSEDLMQFAWQVCTPQVCEALLKVETQMLATLSAEDNLMVAAFRPTNQSEPFVFQFSLNGMEAGLGALAN